MDDSTTGVTLFSGFVSDLLECYEGSRETFAKGLFEMAEGLDLSDPTRPLPIQLYNDMGRWIEGNLGAASLRKAGVAIGERAYDYLVQSGTLAPESTPLEILEGLKRAASEMIQDPRGRGWEIRDVIAGRITMRRTQTFNCLLQEGLLQSLVSRTGAQLVRCEHVSCTRQGAPFCDYDVTWMQ